jgi:hypothetical protein
MEERLRRVDEALVPWAKPVVVGDRMKPIVEGDPRTFAVLLIIEAESAEAAPRTWRERGDPALQAAGLGPGVAHLTESDPYTAVRPIA